MSVRVREFTAGEYEAFARVHNEVNPGHPSTAEEFRRLDDAESRDERLRHKRFLAVDGDDVIGFARYSQNPGMYHPRRFMLEGGVLEAHRGRGTGGVLLERVLAALEPFEAISVRTIAADDDRHAVRFLEARGFREDKRSWESVLDVASFDESRFGELEARIAADGYEIRAISELSDDPLWREKLHAVFSDVRVDVPRSEPLSDINFERFVDFIIDDPGFLPDATFVAVKDGAFVAMSDLYRTDASPDLFVGLTGVRREHRRHGLATALKLRGVAYARSRGVARIQTGNDSMNRPMLAINDAFGFERRPARISFVRALRPEPA